MSTRHPGIQIDVAPVGSALLQALRAHGVLGTGLLARVDVTPPHEIFLLYLAEHGPSRQTALVHYLGRDRSTVTATLQAMERRDLVRRRPSDTDRRAMLVELTEAGEHAAPRAREAWRRLEEATVAGLDDDQHAQLCRLLAIVRDTLDRAIDQQ